jgi:hypothetical protein
MTQQGVWSQRIKVILDGVASIPKVQEISQIREVGIMEGQRGFQNQYDNRRMERRCALTRFCVLLEAALLLLQ